MQKFTDMHSRTIHDGAEVYYNGQFHIQIPTENRIRNGIAIIDGDKLVFAANINGQLQGIGLYWELDGEPCYDLVIDERADFSEPMEPNATMRAVEALDEKYPNAIPIFGGAIWVKSIADIIRMLPDVIHSAKFFKWHAGLADACRTFCSLCFVDHALVECYMGIKFEKLVEEEN
jgi:hypothetical protein